MKLETLAKRIATKTDCPELGHYLLTGELPQTKACIPWKGAVKPKEPWTQLVRHRSGDVYPTLRWPRPVIGYNGQRKGVMRTMLNIVHAHDPSFSFRISQLCEDPLCVNPRHWQLRGRGGYVPSELAPNAVYTGDQPWTPEEVEEMLEVCLEKDPQSWDEIINDPMMEDAPEDVIRELLIRFHKEHLIQ